MRLGWRQALAAHPLLIAAMATALLAMGRTPICQCGFVTVWGDVWSSQNSHTKLANARPATLLPLAPK